MWQVTCSTGTGKTLKLYLNDKISNAAAFDIFNKAEELNHLKCYLRWTPIKVGKVYVSTIALTEE